MKNNLNKILITGSEGYIGTVMADYLINQGYEVSGLDAGFYSGEELYKDYKKPTTVLKKDVRMVTHGDLLGFDAVIHLAELSNDPLGELNTDATMNISHRGTVHLAQTAKEAGVKRFIYSSSCSVYGFNDVTVNEESEVNPLTTYAKIKVMNENKLKEMADENFCPVIFRNATVYGPSPSMRFDLVINNLVGLACAEKSIVLNSNGMAWRPFLHVADLARIADMVLKSVTEKVFCQTFNTGRNDLNFRIHDIAEIIKELIPDCDIVVNENNPDHRSYKADFTKVMKAFPEFEKQKDMRVAIKEMAELFTDIKLSSDKIKSGNFVRLWQINNLKNQGLIDNNYFWIK